MARVMLVRVNSDIYCAPVPLGLMYLSSFIKKAGTPHVVTILDGRAKCVIDDRVYREALLEYRPDIVGIGSLQYEAEASARVAALVKQTLNKCVVVMGGPYASSDYEACLRHDAVDAAVIGEGEESFVELVHRVERGESFSDIKGIAYRDDGRVVCTGEREPIRDIDAIPFPDYDRIDMESYFSSTRPCLTNPVYWKRRGTTVITSRGCPYQCTYCHNIFGKRIRFRSAENVLNEILLLKKRYDIQEVEFLDDAFNFDLERGKQILERLAESGMGLKVSFPNGLRIDHVDEEFIAQLKKANVYKIAFGIETASPRIQAYTKKRIDLVHAKEVIRLMIKSGIHTTGFFMMGFPDETEEEMRATIDYAISTSLHTAAFLIVTPFPGTALWQQARDIIVKRGGDASSLKNYDKISVNLSRVSDRMLYQLRKRAYRLFYFDIRRMYRIWRVVKGKNRLFYNLTRIILLSLTGRR